MALSFLFFVAYLGLSLLFHLTRTATDRQPIRYSDILDYYHYYQSPINDKKIVLTFDDGPDPVYTEPIADILERYEVPATFFFMGERTLVNPGIAHAIAERGFMIGNHTFTHSQNIDSSRRRFGLELASTGYLLERSTGQVPQYYRPPYLLDVGVNATINPYITSPDSSYWPLSLGYIPVGADVDSLDWKHAETDKILASIAEDLDAGGHIMLLHDNKNTYESLDKIIIYLRNKGYEFATLDEVLIPPSHILLTKNLSRGDTNGTTDGEVSLLQWFLYKQGFLDPYALSGTFDSATDEALRAYQATNVEVGSAQFLASPGVTDAYTRKRIAEVSLTTLKPETVASSGFSVGVEKLSLWFASGVIALIPFIFTVTLGLVLVRFLALLGLFTYASLRIRTRKKRADYLVPVSIIVPVWNEEQNIESTLMSLMNNVGIEKEIIVVDDGSTDHTALIVDRLIMKYPHEKITLVSVKNGGKARALNHGIARASHDIIVTMDGDSIFASGAIRALVSHFSDDTVGAVAGKVRTASMKTFFDLMQALEYMIGQNIEKHLLSSVNAVGVIPGPIGAWRKGVLIDAGGFSGDTLVEDQDMTLSVLSLGYHVVYEPHAVAYTETPQRLSEFLKQRFRWVYGSFQCFWKHKGMAVRKPATGISAFVLPNILLFSVILPLTYPIMDIILVWGLLTGQFTIMVFFAVVFTVVDCLYALIGTWKEDKWYKVIAIIPVMRLFYRQMIYYIVIKSLVRALEGRGLKWHRLKKSGEAQRLFFSTFANATPR